MTGLVNCNQQHAIRLGEHGARALAFPLHDGGLVDSFGLISVAGLELEGCCVKNTAQLDVFMVFWVFKS